jgi:hypothetical protein
MRASQCIVAAAAALSAAAACSQPPYEPDCGSFSGRSVAEKYEIWGLATESDEGAWAAELSLNCFDDQQDSNPDGGDFYVHHIVPIAGAEALDVPDTDNCFGDPGSWHFGMPEFPAEVRIGFDWICDERQHWSVRADDPAALATGSAIAILPIDAPLEIGGDGVTLTVEDVPLE